MVRSGRHRVRSSCFRGPRAVSRRAVAAAIAVAVAPSDAPPCRRAADGAPCARAPDLRGLGARAARAAPPVIVPPRRRRRHAAAAVIAAAAAPSATPPRRRRATAAVLRCAPVGASAQSQRRAHAARHACRTTAIAVAASPPHHHGHGEHAGALSPHPLLLSELFADAESPAAGLCCFRFRTPWQARRRRVLRASHDARCPRPSGRRTARTSLGVAQIVSAMLSNIILHLLPDSLSCTSCCRSTAKARTVASSLDARPHRRRGSDAIMTRNGCFSDAAATKAA